ncbi:TetR family transcriptional regulator, partial [Mycobacterium tuberculosis]
ERLVPGRDALAQADPGLAAFYTLTLVSPYVSGESRAYLDYLRAKYLG